MSYRKEKSETELYCEIKEAFQLFDRDNDGMITKEEEMTIMRMFGINPIEKEQKENTNPNNNANPETNEEEVTNPENQTVEFNEFFDNIQHRLKDAENDDEILNYLEEKIKTEFKLENFIKIDGNNIKVVVDSDNKDTDLANKIMRSVQSNYDTKKYITVEFK